VNARGYYAVAFIGVVAIGLASRSYPGLFPAFLGKYPGDALGALMAFCGLGFINPGASTLRLAVMRCLFPMWTNSASFTRLHGSMRFAVRMSGT
jgi:hypothetical protein